jgi:hypothetical protein
LELIYEEVSHESIGHWSLGLQGKTQLSFLLNQDMNAFAFALTVLKTRWKALDANSSSGIFN